MDLKNLDELIDIARNKPKRRVAVSAAADKTLLYAVFEAFKLGFIEPILIGNSKIIIEIMASIGLKNRSYEILDEPDSEISCLKAVALINEGKAEILMKGMVPTATLLYAVLDKEKGLRKRKMLSHFALIQTSYYHKLLGITDVAMNISPDLQEKVNIIENAVEVFHRLGNRLPKVAIIAPLEVINHKIPSSEDAAILTSMNKKNKIRGCIIDGPLALDVAVSKLASDHKGIVSDVAGDADLIVVPDLDTGNTLYKSLVFLSDGIAAAIITGASVPIVLTSRADNEKNKLYSIALAATLV